MANSRFMYFNLLDQDEVEVEVLGGGNNPYYPVSNLKNPQSSVVYRSLPGNPVGTILIDCQTPSPANAFMLVGNSIGTLNITDVLIEANATTDFTTPAFSATVTDLNYNQNIGSHFFTEQTFRYWRLTFTGASDYAEVANIFLGQSQALVNNNVNLGWKMQNEDLSEVSSGRYGQKFIDRITSQRTFKGAFSLLNKDELDVVNDMFEYCGRSRPVWIMIDPAGLTLNDKDMISGYFYFKQRPTISNDYFSLYSTDFTLEEVK